MKVAVVGSRNWKNQSIRNVEILTLADFVVAFWDGESRGTKFVIDYATRRNKDVIVVRE